ncbi:fluoride efflux transporter FluC [Melghirimyces profundicolus]|uniref:fluoride efflux transporter FluC n=1 Tax=Melghirimyces profundicolus TaxID=1242148 RepID=UPI000D3CFAB9|nr:CrcB family protein [Melghirimyces profundicolus]
MIHALWVAAGGFLGAISRYLLGRWLNRPDGQLPWGTLAANLTGSFLLGWMIGSGFSDRWLLFAGTGFMGAFTTFSTLHWEAEQMPPEERNRSLIYLGITYSAGLLAAFLGYGWGSGIM